MKIISALLFFWVILSRPVFAADAENDSHVKIEARKNGHGVTLYARLSDCTEATITLTLNLQNMKASPPAPLTVDAQRRQYFELTTIQPKDPKKSHKYSYNYDFRIGRRLQTAPFPFTYSLPYSDQEFTVLQGPREKFSHKKDSGNEDAIDWEMPVGTTVCAAREGVVVAIRQDSDAGGKDNKYINAANHVVIKHKDNSFAEYSHLKKNSLLVKLGQKVKTNEPLALSGNTGFSSKPHLHLAVYYNIDGKTRKTIPIQFTTKNGVVSLKTGDCY